MEVKKSAQADLERRKPTGFLLGLIVALALLLVALEFTSNPPEESNTDAEFDEMAQDYEMMPPEEQQEYEAPAPLVPAPALTERLNIVEEEVATDIKEEGEKTQEISNGVSWRSDGTDEMAHQEPSISIAGSVAETTGRGGGAVHHQPRRYTYRFQGHEVGRNGS